MKLNMAWKLFNFQGQLSLHQGGKLFRFSCITNQDVLCDVIIIKNNRKLILNNWKKARRAGLYFFQDLFPLISKERKKRKTRNQKEFQVESRAVPEPRSLESSQAGWQEVRQDSDGNLPGLQRKLTQTDVLL